MTYFGGHPDALSADGFMWFDLPAHRLPHERWATYDDYVRVVAEANPKNVRVSWGGHLWTLGGKHGFDSFDAMLAWVEQRRDGERNRAYSSPPTWQIRAIPVPKEA